MAKRTRKENKINFVGLRKLAAMMSFTLVFGSLLLFFPRGRIDFTGGTELHLKFETQTDIDQVRVALEAQGYQVMPFNKLEA